MYSYICVCVCNICMLRALNPCSVVYLLRSMYTSWYNNGPEDIKYFERIIAVHKLASKMKANTHHAQLVVKRIDVNSKQTALT